MRSSGSSPVTQVGLCCRPIVPLLPVPPPHCPRPRQPNFWRYRGEAICQRSDSWFWVGWLSLHRFVGVQLEEGALSFVDEPDVVVVQQEGECQFYIRIPPLVFEPANHIPMYVNSDTGKPPVPQVGDGLARSCKGPETLIGQVGV